MISNDFQELYRSTHADYILYVRIKFSFHVAIQNWPSSTIDRDEIVRLVRNFGNKHSLLEDDHPTVMMENDGYCTVDLSEIADSHSSKSSLSKDSPVLTSQSAATLPNLRARPFKDTSSTLKSAFMRKNVIKQGELTVKTGLEHFILTF